MALKNASNNNQYNFKITPKAQGNVSDKMIKIIVNAVMTNQLALFYNERIKGTPYYKKNLKRTLNMAIKELIKAEREDFDVFFKRVENSIDIVQDNQFDMMEALGNISPSYYVELKEVLIAFNKAPKNLHGLAKKINKEKQ